MVNAINKTISDAMLHMLTFFWALSVIIMACHVQTQFLKLSNQLESRGGSVTATKTPEPQDSKESIIATAVQTLYENPDVRWDRNYPLRL